MTNKGILPQLETAAKTNDGDNRKLVKVGDFAINSRSDRRGSCGISPYDGSVSLINIVMTPRKEMVPIYFEWLFHTVQFGDENYRWGHGIVDDLWTTGWQEMKKITIPFPPLTEQKSIANYLDTKCAEIDALTADIQTQIDTLEQYKRSVVYQVVSKGIQNQPMKATESDVWSSIPESWNLVDIKYIFEIVKRIAGKEGFDILSVTQRGLKIKDISSNEGQIAENYSGYQFVYPTDYVMNHMDLLTGWVDCSTHFGVTSPDYRVFRLINKQNHDLNYWKYVMQCCYMCRIFYSLGQGVSNLGRWRLQTSSFMNFKVPVPPLVEQKEIANYLDQKINDINSIIDQKQEQLETLESYKKSLIYEYVTGKKEVPAAESDVIAVIFDPELVQAYIAHKLGKDNEKGKVYSHKVKYMVDYHIGLGLNIAYTRNYRGPHDVNLDTYIDSIISKGWYRKQKKDGAEILVKGKNYTDFINNHSDIFNQYESDIDNLIKYLKTLTRGQIERIATLYAVWNDFIIDGKTNPTEEEIITEVVTNWTKNKANFQHTTWQESLNQMKQHGIIPKGQGLHTIVKA